MLGRARLYSLLKSSPLTRFWVAQRFTAAISGPLFNIGFSRAIQSLQQYRALAPEAIARQSPLSQSPIMTSVIPVTSDRLQKQLICGRVNTKWECGETYHA